MKKINWKKAVCVALLFVLGLQAAGCGIAMRNAPDPVKEAADMVTRSDNDQDGLAETMRRLL